MVEPKKVTDAKAGGLEGEDIWGDDAIDPIDEFAKMTDEEIKAQIKEIDA